LKLFTIWPALELITPNNLAKLIKSIRLAKTRLGSLESHVEPAVSYSSVSSGDKVDTLVARGVHYKTIALNLKVQVARRLSWSARTNWLRGYLGLSVILGLVYSCVAGKGHGEFGDLAVWLALQWLNTRGDEHAAPHSPPTGPDLFSPAMALNEAGLWVKTHLSHTVRPPGLRLEKFPTNRAVGLVDRLD
jgi:hypothetical protein